MRRLLAVALLVSACGGAASPALSPTSPPSPTTQPTDVPEPSATPTAASPSVEPMAAWTQLEAAGDSPAAREDHTWIVDPEAETAYLFGGRDRSTVFGDLFVFDLATDTWRRLEPTGPTPPARFGHEAAWVEDVGLVVFAGQANATTFFGDLWAYDPAANRWAELPANGDAPVPRYGSCSGLGPDGRLWISHGFTEDGTRFFDTKAYDFDLERWTDLTPEGRLPVERCLHACWWTADGRFALYGGQTTGVSALGDQWTLVPGGGPTTSGSWTKFEGDGLPPERALVAFARHGDDEILFGGRGLNTTYLADTYVVDRGFLGFVPLATTGESPGGRASATLIDDPSRARVLLYGGIGADGALADVWQLTTP